MRVMSKLTLPVTGKTGITLQANGSHLDLYLFGVIGDWWDGNTANEVLYKLRNALDIKTITVKLSTIGGYFEDGLPIYNLLKQHSAHVTVEILGYALSMGSVIMLAGDRIKIAQNALVMMHNAQGVAWGSPADMRKAADMLAKHEQAILPRYMERMGKDAQSVQSLLDAETWFTADEALAAGLVDEIIDPVDLSAIDKKQPENAWQFAAKNFKHPPELFFERVDNASRNRPWVERILNRVVGHPLANLSPHEQTPNEVDMNSDDIAEKVAAKLAIKNEPVLAAKDAEIAALTNRLTSAENAKVEQMQKNSALETELLAARSTIAAQKKLLDETDPGTVPPINNQPAGKFSWEFGG